MVGEVVSEMEYLRTREQKLRDTNESTNERVKWFAFGTMGMLIGLGAWQVVYLRAYFRFVSFSFPSFRLESWMLALSGSWFGSMLTITDPSTLFRGMCAGTWMIYASMMITTFSSLFYAKYEWCLCCLMHVLVLSRLLGHIV